MQMMTGSLLPPWFEEATPHENDILIATFFFGFTLSIAAFSFAKAFRQTYRSCSRSHRLSAYVVMIWLEWAACVIVGVISWLNLMGIIQCLMHILANRVSLIMYDPIKSRKLKWAVGLAIGVINITVFCIWIPAQMQINERYMRANMIWDRVEKCLFLILDGSLNCYFMWLVRSKLVANGLTKYRRIYQFNLALVCCSICLDILIIGVMSLPDGLLYIQAHPFAYLIKLHIEMNMAELISKVVRKCSKEKNTRSTAEGVHKAETTNQIHNNNDDDLERRETFMASMQCGGQMHPLNMDMLDILREGPECHTPELLDPEMLLRRSGETMTGAEPHGGTANEEDEEKDGPGQQQDIMQGAAATIMSITIAA
ncbi:hypothetical protein B0H63DRAFT_519034 [Podospora didyma]|uniref:Uncharacterized protein n=1 Tax=Podospora didyma TaxID=330526 RepID=A0AAE0U407_9PEZI|nr:hypothetical protein B0H63DRAFT_519034 [Podospora didyma]